MKSVLLSFIIRNQRTLIIQSMESWVDLRALGIVILVYMLQCGMLCDRIELVREKSVIRIYWLRQRT